MKIAELKTSDMDATRAAILFETRVAPYSECLAMEDILLAVGYNKPKEDVLMIYSICEIQQRIAPVAKQYGVKAVFLFGSYARGETREDSDIDLLVDTSGTNLRTLLSLGALYCDLEAALQKPIELITVSALEQRAQMPSEEMFKETVMKERLNVYDAA